ncbi:putative PPPDE peptidase domain-containing protein [Helianthus annuus]|nr:putative PPPDE peptidase domain-containing protein [Helianthus annuus]
MPFIVSIKLLCIAVPMIQNLETTLRAGAVPQAPQFSHLRFNQFLKCRRKSTSSNAKSKTETVVPPAVVPTGTPQEKSAVDPLGDVRNKVQEEIGKEFAAIMASGTLRASEAAALATKKVM